MPTVCMDGVREVFILVLMSARLETGSLPWLPLCLSVLPKLLVYKCSKIGILVLQVSDLGIKVAF